VASAACWTQAFWDIAHGFIADATQVLLEPLEAGCKLCVKSSNIGAKRIIEMDLAKCLIVELGEEWREKLGGWIAVDEVQVYGQPRRSARGQIDHHTRHLLSP
jgi:hypothetical protein